MIAWGGSRVDVGINMFRVRGWRPRPRRVGAEIGRHLSMEGVRFQHCINRARACQMIGAVYRTVTKRRGLVV